MRSKLLASVSALALATLAACGDAPTAPSGKPSLFLDPGPPCVLIGQPTGNQTFKAIRDNFIVELLPLVNENALNCGQANQLLVHVDNTIDHVLAGRCMAATNSATAAARYIDKLVEEEAITNVQANQLKGTLHAIARAAEAAGLCEGIDVGVIDAVIPT